LDKKEGLFIEQFFNPKPYKNKHHLKNFDLILPDFSFFNE